MIKLKNLLREIEDYHSLHTAPTPGEGESLDNLSAIYPDDIYGYDAARNYGAGEPYDGLAISIIQHCRNRPKAMVKIYRAVPSVITAREKMVDLIRQKAYIQKYGKVPPNINTQLDTNKYYDKIHNELNKLDELPLQTEKEPKVTINPGDWVTISRAYAKEHGESQLGGRYRILSKTVPARTLFTTGDSIHEWGYNP